MACGPTAIPHALHPDLLVVAQPGRAVVRLLTYQKLRRGVHRSIQALQKDICECITDWNDSPRPFNWIKTADEILERLASYLQRIPGAGH
jgi:hypothetical protein